MTSIHQLKIHCIEHGQGPTCLFFHGFGFHSGVWFALQAALGDMIHTVAIDLPGFGYTPMMTWSHFYQQLAVSIKDPVWLVGWSLGGMVAIEFASLFPEKVRGIILIASNPCFIEKENWPGIPKHRLQAFTKQLSEQFYATLHRFLALQWPRDISSRQAIRQMKRIIEVVPKPSKAALDSALTFLMDNDFRDHLQRLTCQAVFILGRLDAFVPEKLASSMSCLLPQIEIQILPSAAHAPFLSHREETIEIIKPWLQK